MPLPSATYISELDPNRPLGAEDIREGDDWFRLLIGVLQQTFPTADAALPISSWAAKNAGSLTKALDYTLLAADDGKTIFVDASGGSRIITLPSASAVDKALYTVVKTDSSSNTVTLAGTVSGVVNPVLRVQWGTLTVYSNGSVWSALSGTEPLDNSLQWRKLATGYGVAGQILTSNGPVNPPTWQTGVPTGVAYPYIGLTAPSGYVLANGTTIGSASSGASQRANADCEVLFKLLWDSWADAQAAVGGGRGASADDDWLANKAIAVPDMRDLAFVGLGNIGGVDAGLITAASTNGANAIIPGGVIGEETHTLVEAEMPAHTHGLNLVATESGGGTTRPSSSGTSVQTGSAGGDQPHSNTQPGMMWNVIVRL